MTKVETIIDVLAFATAVVGVYYYGKRLATAYKAT